MTITHATTLAELQLQLTKLGIENFYWRAHNPHSGVSFGVTISGHGVTSIGFGADLISAINVAIGDFTQQEGARLAEGWTVPK